MAVSAEGTDAAWERQKQSAKQFRQVVSILPGKTKGEIFQGGIMPLLMMMEDDWRFIAPLLSIQDRLSLCRTNSQLDALFVTNKNEWLFEEVLPFLLKHLSGNHTFPPNPIPNRPNVLVCRQLCKAWRKAVDEFLEQEHSCRRDFGRGNCPREPHSCRTPSSWNVGIHGVGLTRLEFDPGSVHRLTAFPRNSQALVGRSAKFIFSPRWNPEENRRFRNEVHDFLKLYGVQVKYLELDYYFAEPVLSVFYPMICEFLSFVPNLRSLKVSCPCYSFEEEQADVFIRGSTLPTLRFLHLLDISSLPNKMLNHLFDHFGSTLKSVLLEKRHLVEGLRFPCHLEELELWSIRQDFNSVLSTLYSVESFRSLIHLKKLYLRSLQCSLSVETPKLLKVLKQYPNLAEVRLSFIILSNTEAFCGWATEEYAQAPNVKYFEIQAPSPQLFGFSPLLLAFPNLKYLHIMDNSSPAYNWDDAENPEVRNRYGKVEIEQYLADNRLVQCPIWETLDDLQVITFRSINGNFGRSCNREQVSWSKQNKETKGWV